MRCMSLAKNRFCFGAGLVVGTNALALLADPSLIRLAYSFIAG